MAHDGAGGVGGDREPLERDHGFLPARRSAGLGEADERREDTFSDEQGVIGP